MGKIIYLRFVYETAKLRAHDLVYAHSSQPGAHVLARPPCDDQTENEFISINLYWGLRRKNAQKKKKKITILEIYAGDESSAVRCAYGVISLFHQTATRHHLLTTEFFLVLVKWLWHWSWGEWVSVWQWRLLYFGVRGHDRNRRGKSNCKLISNRSDKCADSLPVHSSVFWRPPYSASFSSHKKFPKH